MERARASPRRTDARVVGAGGRDAEEENDGGEGAIAGRAIEVADAGAVGDGEGHPLPSRGWGEPLQRFDGRIEDVGYEHGGLDGCSSLVGPRPGRL